ncbi:tyrosine-type recombinase/integrase [Acidisoma cellulosilytica]|uniref:Tyrosine-type recombinase/integrase n=1 Tax=Acidisoma cellulosilyticum TaxID=2802395 RepID=A0A964E5N1_9PROT|nr:tyrosine-type recombinase/integrase [Acidisoma cellulosilyticum]MCB8882706.1 tyrosine-type recombinase/integrase [Acidisoma cellulosilyticum]
MESRDRPQAAAQKPLSATTLKIYADDWRAFCDWCAAQNASYLPALSATVAAYLTMRQNNLGGSGLRVAHAAIAFHHRQAGLAWSSTDPVIATLLRDVAKTQTRAVRPAAALTATEIALLLSSCDHDPGGRAGFLNLRDRALLSIGFAGGLRRSELVALDCEDLDFTTAGLTLRIRNPRSDQPSAAASSSSSLIVSRGTQAETCPVQAMEIWLRRSGIEYGPIFPRLTAAGTIEARLTGNGVWKILRRRAAQVGLQAPAGQRLSPHGMRAGFIAEAYGKGAAEAEVMAQARQKDRSTARRYRPRAGSPA